MRFAAVHCSASTPVTCLLLVLHWLWISASYHLTSKKRSVFSAGIMTEVTLKKPEYCYSDFRIGVWLFPKQNLNIHCLFREWLSVCACEKVLEACAFTPIFKWLLHLVHLCLLTTLIHPTLNFEESQNTSRLVWNSQGPKTVRCWNRTRACIFLSFLFFLFFLLEWQVWWITSQILPVWYQVFRGKRAFPSFLVRKWPRVRKGNSDFLSKFPVTVWTHEKTSCCVSAGLRRDLVVSEPPCGNLWCPFWACHYLSADAFFPRPRRETAR